MKELPWATIMAGVVLVVGGVAVIQHSLSWKEYIESVTVMVGVLGVGRGLAAKTPN